MKLLKKIILSCMFSICAVNIYAQDKENKNLYDNLNYEIVTTLGYNFNSNVSPLGLKYYKSFEKAVSGTNFSVFYNIKNNWHIGIDFDYSSLLGNVEELKINDTSRFIYLGFLAGKSYKLKDSKWRLNDMYSIGYCLNYSSLDNWDNNKVYNVFANALGINLKYTLSYKLFDRVSFGFVSGTKIFCALNWFGNNTYINDNAYFNRLFSLKYNLIIIPYIGISASTF